MAAPSNLTLRVLTALVAVPVVLGLTWVGGWPFALFIALIAVLAQREVYSLVEARGEVAVWRGLGYLLGLVMALRVYVPWAWDALLLGFVGVLLVELVRSHERPLQNVAGTLIGVLYPATLLGFLPLLRENPSPFLSDTESRWLTLAVFFLIWATDTAAYFVGRSFSARGKVHLLFPRVSPKKTWEGSIGGLVGAMLVALVLQKTVLNALPLPHVLALGLICGGVSQLGDLVESLFKRAAGVKDSAQFLPGHGGLLDRFDALLVAVPLVYLYLQYVTALF